MPGEPIACAPMPSRSSSYLRRLIRFRRDLSAGAESAAVANMARVWGIRGRLAGHCAIP